MIISYKKLYIHLLQWLAYCHSANRSQGWWLTGQWPHLAYILGLLLPFWSVWVSLEVTVLFSQHRTWAKSIWHRTCSFNLCLAFPRMSSCLPTTQLKSWGRGSPSLLLSHSLGWLLYEELGRHQRDGLWVVFVISWWIQLDEVIWISGCEFVFSLLPLIIWLLEFWGFLLHLELLCKEEKYNEAKILTPKIIIFIKICNSWK